jgi:hypothetical protein
MWAKVSCFGPKGLPSTAIESLALSKPSPMITDRIACPFCDRHAVCALAILRGKFVENTNSLIVARAGSEPVQSLGLQS